MSSLKEIKGRIASVQNTLKITSAMKMVASAKLHRVQTAAEALAQYTARLERIAAAVGGDPERMRRSPLVTPHGEKGHAVVIAVASDLSLCGGFNANALRTLHREVEALREEGFERVTVCAVGEKMVQAVRKAGYTLCETLRDCTDTTCYDAVAAEADRLMADFSAGTVDRVRLAYNHFHSLGHQEPRRETWLPMEFTAPADPAADTAAEGSAPSSEMPDYIFEPTADQLLLELLPYTLRTRLYETLLDSQTAEHAARTVAMQTATDNAKDLLEELSLTYNKQRQQAITNELADITQASN